MTTADTTTTDLCEAGWPIVNRYGPDNYGLTMVTSDKSLCSGQVTTWTYQGKVSLPFRAVIFRPLTDSDTQFKVVGINHIPAGAANTPVIYSVPEADRITVQDGDVIGWTSGNAVITWNFGETTIVRWVGGNLHVGLAADQIIDINAGYQAREYSIRATVESSDSGTTFAH